MNTPNSIPGRALMLKSCLEAKLTPVFKIWLWEMLLHSSGSASGMGTAMGETGWEGEWGNLLHWFYTFSWI